MNIYEKTYQQPMYSPFFHTLKKLRIKLYLEDRCWEVIEENTEEAVTSDDFVTLERSLIESVVKRERLTKSSQVKSIFI